MAKAIALPILVAKTQFRIEGSHDFKTSHWATPPNAPLTNLNTIRINKKIEISPVAPPVPVADADHPAIPSSKICSSLATTQASSHCHPSIFHVRGFAIFLISQPGARV
jgi:hypothetical protein